MSGENRFAVLPKLVVGLAIVAFGAILLLDNLGMIDGDVVLRWFWPAALYTLGFTLLTRGPRSGGFFWGLVWVGVASLLLLHRLGYQFAFDVWGLFWPLVLLLFGAHMVRRSLTGPALRRQSATEGVSEPSLGPGDERGSVVNSFAFLSGNELQSTSTEFRGGDLSAFMGAVELDLRQAKTAPEGALLDVFAMWGGIEIKVPAGWQVTSQVTPILGGYSDKTQAPAGEPGRHLTVRGFVMMGGVEIKN